MVRLHKIEYAKMKYVVEYLWKKFLFSLKYTKKELFFRDFIYKLTLKQLFFHHIKQLKSAGSSVLASLFFRNCSSHPPFQAW